MASEPIQGKPGANLPAILAQWSHPSRPVRGVIVIVVAVVLAATLVFLYIKTQGVDFKRQNEVLGYLRELKEIDARWDVEVLRVRTEVAAPLPQGAALDHGAALARIRRELTAAAQDVRSAVLQRSLPDLSTALIEKADLVATYKRANAQARAPLERVMGAETEIAGLVRGAWQDYTDRERLVAVENAVTQLLAESQEYFYSSADGQRKTLHALLADLRDSAPKLPAALQAGIARLDSNVRELLEAKPVEVEIGNKLAFLTAGPRIDSVTSAFSRELEDALSSRELYRIYLIAYSGSLLMLIGYLASRLLGSYRLLNQANLALKTANEGLEQRVAERTRELTETLEQLKESETQLIQSEKMSSLGQMVAGVAHEINTPLAYVKNSLGSVKKNLPQLTLLAGEAEKLLFLLQSGAADPQQLSRQFTLVQTLVKQLKQHQVLEELQALIGDGLHGIAQISDIVINLKDFSRLDRERISSYDLNEGLQSTLLLAKHEIKHVTIKKQFGKIPPVTCSPSQINQVFLNLITNAAQAVQPGGGKITVTTRSEGADRVAVDIEDNGTGIPADVLPKIFDTFFTTKKVGQGTGLGLSIVYKIVHQHGGDIHVDSQAGVGSKFTVVLPVTLPDSAEVTTQNHSLTPQPL